MPASQTKIITKLRERRQIEADLRRMLTASSELEFRLQAQQIATQGSQVIPAIVGSLDRADARLLAAMGVVATFLDHEEVARALQQVVLQPQRTDRGRIGALTILERFLGQPLDDDLLVSLRDAEGVAVSSLEEILGQAERSPAVLIEYVQGLDRQEPDVVLAVVQALRDMGTPSPPSGQGQRVIEPLRMMAQDVRDEIAAAALQTLGAIRSPEAAWALQTLIPISAPALRPLAERWLRKLQFSGVEIEPLPPPNPGWRSLVSPVDGSGQQSVWCIQESEPASHARFLNILLSDRVGAVEAVGHTQVPPTMLPPRRPLGYVHDVAWPDGSGSILLLEAPFDLGRRWVLEALAHNHETQIPVAGPLRLLSPWLWGASGADSLPARVLPELSEEAEAEDEALLAVSDRLLNHPAFATWTVRSEAILQAAEEALRHPGWDLQVWVRRLVSELFADQAVTRVFSRRLAAMSEWLLLAGEQIWSRMALVAAHAALEKLPQGQPLLWAIVRRDLELTLDSLKYHSRPVFGI
jgi:hypothetical protein